MESYVVAISKKNRENYVTWCSGYHFDPIMGQVILYGATGDVCGSVNMTDEDFVRCDIYNKLKPQEGPEQTYLKGAV